MPYKYVKHIITTRKIINKYNAAIVLSSKVVVKLLENIKILDAVFSFHTPEEILSIINFPLGGNTYKAFYGNPENDHILYTFFYSCLSHMEMFIYMLKYLDMYNVSTYIIPDNGEYHGMSTYNTANRTAIINHETKVAFYKSLRYTWVNACLFLEKREQKY